MVQVILGSSIWLLRWRLEADTPLTCILIGWLLFSYKKRQKGKTTKRQKYKITKWQRPKRELNIVMSVSNSCNDFGCLLSQIYSQMVVFSSSFLSHNSCLSHCCRSYSSLLLQSRPREWGEQLNTFQIQIYCCVFFDFSTIRDNSVIPGKKWDKFCRRRWSGRVLGGLGGWGVRASPPHGKPQGLGLVLKIVLR